MKAPPMVVEAVTEREPVEVALPVLRATEVSRPVLETEKSVVVAVAVEELMAKSTWLVSVVLAPMENFAKGEVVPTPTEPLPATRNVEIPPEVKTSRAYALDEDEAMVIETPFGPVVVALKEASRPPRAPELTENTAEVVAVEVAY